MLLLGGAAVEQLGGGALTNLDQVLHNLITDNPFMSVCVCARAQVQVCACVCACVCAYSQKFSK